MKMSEGAIENRIANVGKEYQMPMSLSGYKPTEYSTPQFGLPESEGNRFSLGGLNAGGETGGIKRMGLDTSGVPSIAQYSTQPQASEGLSPMGLLSPAESVNRAAALGDRVEKGLAEGREGRGTLGNLFHDTAAMLPMMGRVAAAGLIPKVGKVIGASMWAQQGMGSILRDVIKEGGDPTDGIEVAMAAGEWRRGRGMSLTRRP
jgi:hypothetical protein